MKELQGLKRHYEVAWEVFQLPDVGVVAPNCPLIEIWTTMVLCNRGGGECVIYRWMLLIAPLRKDDEDMKDLSDGGENKKKR